MSSEIVRDAFFFDSQPAEACARTTVLAHPLTQRGCTDCRRWAWQRQRRGCGSAHVKRRFPAPACARRHHAQARLPRCSAPGRGRAGPDLEVERARFTPSVSPRGEARPRCAGATDRAPFPPAAPNRPRTLGKGSARGPSGLRRRRGGIPEAGLRNCACGTSAVAAVVSDRERVASCARPARLPSKTGFRRPRTCQESLIFDRSLAATELHRAENGDPAMHAS